MTNYVSELNSIKCLDSFSLSSKIPLPPSIHTTYTCTISHMNTLTINLLATLFCFVLQLSATGKRMRPAPLKDTIYVLELEQGKYYVGKTTKPVQVRFSEHKWGKGAAWTRKYRPIRILYTEDSQDVAKDPRHAENIIVKETMWDKGIQNVRGGPYVRMDLEDWIVESIEWERASFSDECFKCRQKGHFAGQCELSDTDEDLEGEEEDNVLSCSRCARPLQTHTSGSCFWKTDILGNRISAPQLKLL